MNFLEERIVKDGVIKPGNVLKVDSFLNHQMDICLLEEIGKEFKRRFNGKNVTKILTIEASGIGIAAFAAKEFGVPMVFAKKSKSSAIFSPTTNPPTSRNTCFDTADDEAVPGEPLLIAAIRKMWGTIPSCISLIP